MVLTTPVWDADELLSVFVLERLQKHLKTVIVCETDAKISVWNENLFAIGWFEWFLRNVLAV